MSDQTPYCKRYSEFELEVLAATEEFFASDPWQGTFDERTEKCRRWVSTVAAYYDVPAPQLLINATDLVALMTRGYLLTDPPAIVMPKHSATTLFFLFRRWLAFNSLSPNEVPDARGWAQSLYFAVRPDQYARAVSAGQIIDPFADSEEEEESAL